MNQQALNSLAEEIAAIVRATGQTEAILSTIDEVAQRKACEESLAEFVKQAWHIVEPGTELVWNWHLDVVCAYMEAVYDGRIKKLIVNIPPGTMKSLVIMVFYPAWVWTKRPSERFLCGTNESTLATRDALRMRQIVESEWYQSRWGDNLILSKEQADKTLFANTKRGHRESQGFLGKITGKRGSQLLIDDPHDTKQAESDVQRQEVLDKYDQAWSTRRNDMANDPIVVVMQRVHYNDLTAHLMKKRGWVRLAIPMRYDLEVTYDPAKDIGRPDLADPRTKEGELMFPAKFPEQAVQDLEEDLGAYGTAGQLQQRPAPKGGGIIKPALVRLWPNNKPLPVMQYVLQSYDTAFTEKTQNDPTACSVWGIFWHEGRNNVMLIDCWQEWVEFPDLRARVIKEWSAKYAGDPKDPANKPRAPDMALIEKKGSGISLMQDLRKAKIRMAEYNPGLSDKVARAHLITPILDAGLVWIPESKQGDAWPTWARWLEIQLGRFPNDEHDDGVDTVTQALRFLRDKGFLVLGRSRRGEDVERPPPKELVNPYAV